MPNVHTPERQADEAQRAYKTRRMQSALLVKLMTKGPRQQPFVPKINANGMQEPVPMGFYWLGQHTNDAKNRSRKAKRAAGSFRQYNRDLKFARRMLRGDLVAQAKVDGHDYD